jgi:hypothetical protein
MNPTPLEFNVGIPPLLATCVGSISAWEDKYMTCLKLINNFLDNCVIFHV